MDQRPFFQFDLLDHRPHHVAELGKFTREQFDLDLILATANTLKYSSAVRNEFIREIENPSEELVKMMAARVYEGRLSRSVRDEFQPIVANALRETIREMVNKRLTSALEVTSDRPASEEASEEEGGGIVTTADEIEAYHIIKSVVRTVVASDRVAMRDAKSYCSVLLD